MVNFGEFQKWIKWCHSENGDFTFSGFHNYKRSFPISFIGIGDFENIDILKEGRGFNLGVIWKMGFSGF